MQFIIDNFDTVVKLAFALVATVGFYFGIKSEISGLRSDITHIKENQKALAEAFTQLGSILTKVAVQDTRLNMLEKKIDELSHGQGFVKVIRS